MREYTVTVYCTVRETYSVMASSADEAADLFHTGEMVESDNQSIDDVFAVAVDGEASDE